MHSTEHSTDLNAPLPPQGFLDTLSDDELYTALDAAALYRNTKLQELPAVLMGEMGETGEDEVSKTESRTAPSEAHTLDWQIMQSGALITKCYVELCRRDPSLPKILNTES